MVSLLVNRRVTQRWLLLVLLLATSLFVLATQRIPPTTRTSVASSSSVGESAPQRFTPPPPPQHKDFKSPPFRRPSLPSVPAAPNVASRLPPPKPTGFSSTPGVFIPYPKLTTHPVSKINDFGAYPPVYASSELVPNIATWDGVDIPVGATLDISADDFRVPTGTFNQKPPALGPNGKPVKGIKYFHEKANHFDARYFKGKTEGEVRLRHIKNMFAAWARFADERRIPYWIAHGSLLGWHFGGRVMAWDDDMDIQVNANMLYELTRYNLTRGSGNDTQYLLDVNPHHMTRYHERENVIDARFIDTLSGHFIDITGLALTSVDHYTNEITVGCKSPHRYPLSTLFPLVRVLFEGVPTWRPFNTSAILEKEYKTGVLKKIKHNKHTFDPVKGRWFKDPTLPSAARIKLPLNKPAIEKPLVKPRVTNATLAVTKPPVRKSAETARRKTDATLRSTL
ncbi:hypothetical protein PhCBS80983_g03903 [Powellomyces hirtus]|uniref:LicD/FKTN/FKRP nucleotidyltransferase domain-containing protein n=1 Tax=Powellomyces hirtus TaxID=109895 RepID=A0A507E0P0_9FUNG|nr:hypothetical protein PhCBS80983_g03903 [Powellomyces hirtus]